MGAAVAIPAIKGNQREFQCSQITKDGFDWNDRGSVTADGDGKIFKFESKEGQDHLCVEFYDETKSSWTKVERKGDWPNRLDHHSTTLNYMNPYQIFLFGGNDCKERKRSNDLWLFHTQTLLFKKMEVNSEKPKGRNCHQAVMMRKKIVIFGGWDGGQYIHDMWIFHLNKEGCHWKKVQCNGDWPNIGNSSSSHATDDQTIWTVTFDKTLWKFEFVNCTWTKVGWNMHELQTPKIFGVGHWLLLTGKVDGNSCQIFCFNAKGHETSQPVNFAQMTPVDQDSKNVNDYIDLGQYSYRFACCPKPKKGWIIIAKNKGTNKYHLFSLKISGDEEIQAVIDYMARIRLSEKDADMSLVVGKDKTIVRLHKMVMTKNPWFNRCLDFPSEYPIQMPNCEKKEVSEVLDYIYTGNIEWPDDSDWKAWIKTFNAVKKFEIEELTAEAFVGLKNATVNEKAFADAFYEASIHPLSYGMDALVEMFGNHPERKKIYRALKSKDVMSKKLMLKMLVLAQGDVSDNPIILEMGKMLCSGEYADMCLVIGRDKTKIPLHKIIMRRSPWIDSCVESSTENSIPIPDCEENEVFNVLLHLYTGKIQWPDEADGEGWIKLINVLKKFEIDHLASKAADGLKNATTDPETFVDAFQEASVSSLPFGLEAMIEIFGTHEERKKIFHSLKAKNILKKDLMLQTLVHMQGDVFDDCVFDTLSGEKRCSICFQVLKSPFQCLVPCGHSTTCADCLGKIRSSDFKCPLCRKDITDVQQAYL